MAGSFVLTTSKANGLTRYNIAWTSDASGDVNTTTMSVKPGELVEVTFTPSGGGTAPTTLYDVTIPDADAVDILAGTGANLSATVAATVVPVVSTYFRKNLTGGLVTPTVANAGNAKAGTIVLLVR